MFTCMCTHLCLCMSNIRNITKNPYSKLYMKPEYYNVLLILKCFCSVKAKIYYQHPADIVLPLPHEFSA